MSRRFPLLCLLAVMGLSVWVLAVPRQTEFMGRVILVSSVWAFLGLTYIRHHASYYRAKPEYVQTFNAIYALVIVGTGYGLMLHFTDGYFEVVFLLSLLGMGIWVVVQQVLRANIQEKNYHLAHQSLEKVQALIPANPYIYITRANIYYAQFQFEQSALFASQAIERLTDEKKKDTQPIQPTNNALIQAYQARFNASLALEDGPMAVSDAEVLVQAFPNNPTAYLNRAVAFMKDGNIAAATSDLESITHMTLLPLDETALKNALGHLAYTQGDYEQSYTKYREALKVELVPPQPGFHAVIHNNLGMLALAEGRSDMARTAFQAAQKLAPQAATEGLALFYAQREEWYKALEMWQMAITRNPLLANEEYQQKVYRWSPHLKTLVAQITTRLESQDA